MKRFIHVRHKQGVGTVVGDFQFAVHGAKIRFDYLPLMKVWFYPEKRRTAEGRLITEQCPLLMRVTVGGQRITLGTGMKIDLGQWDEQLHGFASTHRNPHL
ncbi:MAG: hypothetical protein R2751_15125 [Bacteroidales bacterium]